MNNFLPKARYYRPGSMIRTNKPIVGVNSTIAASDLGVAVNAAGVHITLPPINPTMQGEVYTVKNLSSGDITAGPSGTDKITTAAGQITSATIASDDSVDFDVETTTNTWTIR